MQVLDHEGSIHRSVIIRLRSPDPVLQVSISERGWLPRLPAHPFLRPKDYRQARKQETQPDSSHWYTPAPKKQRRHTNTHEKDGHNDLAILIRYGFNNHIY